jgi:hypothetical protein
MRIFFWLIRVLWRTRFLCKIRVFFFFAYALWGSSSYLLSATFTANLDRQSVTVGESATLTLTFEGGQPKDIPGPPNIPNVQVSSQGTAFSTQIVNGQSSTTVSANFALTPTQPGDFVIPSFTATIGGEKLATQPLTLKALKAGAPSPEAINSGSQITFLKLVLPRKQVYAGESFLAQLDLYVQNNVRITHFQTTSFPAEGCIVGKMTQGNAHRVQVGNNVYTVVPLMFPLKSLKSGRINIGPVTAQVVAEIPSERGRRGDSLFERFGLSMGFGVEQKQLTLATEGEVLQSLALPTENVPANFNGAVGSFTMNVTAGPTNVTVGDPITIRMQLSGRGSFDTLTLPEQFTSADFKAYPATVKATETTDPFGMQGSKTFEQVVVPQNAEIKQLPPVSFSYFDPEKAAYKTLTQPAMALVVKPGAAPPPPTIATATRRQEQENGPPAQDIVPIKTRLGTVGQISLPLAQQPWFVALQAIPFLVLVSSVIVRRRAENFANNPRLRRQKQVVQIIKEGLVDLRRLAAENKSDEFFASLFRLLQEQIGERLDLPAFAITEAVIEEQLIPRGAPESTLGQVRELFQACNLARYAPVRSSHELAAFIPKLESTLGELQNLKL